VLTYWWLQAAAAVAELPLINTALAVAVRVDWFTQPG